jgi:hypothetical protein
MTTSHHSRQAVAYVPYGSFQNPSSPHLAHHTHKRIQDLQSAEMIKQEVTSSFDVKPLYPRPLFPRQAQLLPPPNAGLERTVLQPHQNGNRKYPLTPPSYQGEFYLAQGMAAQSANQNQHQHQNFDNAGDENFVYIHRQNSFIDVSQMTHHDHSHPRNVQAEQTPRGRSRSNEEVDAAMTLATCLQVDKNP